MSTLKEQLIKTHAGLNGSLVQGDAWLAETRHQALRRFEEIGIPSLRDEDWKYTNLKPLEKYHFRPSQTISTAISTEFTSTLDCYRLVFVNGRFSSGLSVLSGVPQGVEIRDLNSVLQNDANALKPWFSSIAPKDSHGLTALNTAYVDDGAFVKIPDNDRLDKPLELVFISDASVVTDTDETLLTQPRNMIVVGENAQAQIIERYEANDDERTFTNAVTEIVLAKGANIEHTKLQEESLKTYHVGGLFVKQDSDSRFTSNCLSFGAQLARNDIATSIDAEGAECHLNGFYLGTGRQHVDNHTQINHAKPHGTSREFYKGILDGRARAVFHGRIIVQPDAQKTDSDQQNNNLLLSRDAEVDTKPQLEIYADDVKCAHGATVGQLDEDTLFYLRSRGVDYEQAQDLLTYAFANEVLSRVNIEPLKEYLENTLSERLLHGRHFEEVI